MNLRKLLLRLAKGIEREKYDHMKEAKADFESGYEALKFENRLLKTKIKDLKLQSQKRKKA